MSKVARYWQTRKAAPSRRAAPTSTAPQRRLASPLRNTRPRQSLAVLDAIRRRVLLGRPVGANAGRLVVARKITGCFGPRIARKIRQAMRARLPFVVLGRPGLMVVPRCRIEVLPEDQRGPWRALRIVLSGAGAPCEAPQASTQAMGATRHPGWRAS
jgi:hypothetical protein